MIKRNEQGIVGQHDIYNPNAPIDLGDSAARTGILAMCGSIQDIELLPLFEIEPGFCARAPKGNEPYDNIWSFSRDQLLQYVAGLPRHQEGSKIAARLLWTHMERFFFCQNKLNTGSKPKPWYVPADILTPSHVGHLIRVVKCYPLYPFLLVSYLWLLFDIYWSTKVKPTVESNQIVAMCSVAGKWALRLYVKMHPDFKTPLYNYWGGWRDQGEIANAIIDYIEDTVGVK
jgi:hypothetical protein